MRACSTEGCTRDIEYPARGLCRRCYRNQPDQRQAAQRRERANAEKKNGIRRDRYANDADYAAAVRACTRASANARYRDNPEWKAKRQARAAAYRARPEVKEQRSEWGKAYKASRADDLEVKRRNRDTARARNTGFPPDLFDRCLAVQGGVCALCNRAFGDKPRGADSMAADHFETLGGERVRSGVPGATKHPRGVLCSICNQALGMYEWHLNPRGIAVPAFDAYLSDPPARKIR